MDNKKIMLNRRLLAILVLGFASGLPLALTGATLQAWFTEANINVVTIGMLSLLGIPYTLKFLWAPIMDHYSLTWLGKRKSWILLTQIGIVITLLVLAQLNPGTHISAMFVVALLIAFCSASQDISITAYQADVLHPEERGLGVAYYVFTYRLAALISGGLALVCADYFGWKITYELMAVMILFCMIPTYQAPAPQEFAVPVGNIFNTIFVALKDLLQRDKIILLLFFIVFYKLGDALALQLISNFLLHGLGFTLTQVGLVYKTASFAGTVLGAFIGGMLLIRWNIYRALLTFGIAQALSTFMFVVLALAGKQIFLMAFAVFLENFCTGLSTAALVSFLMSLCNHRYTASQFALLSAIAAIGRVFLGPLAGFLVKDFGWVQFFFASFLLSFPGIIILVFLKDRVYSYAQAVIE